MKRYKQRKKDMKKLFILFLFGFLVVQLSSGDKIAVECKYSYRGLMYIEANNESGKAVAFFPRKKATYFYFTDNDPEIENTIYNNI